MEKTTSSFISGCQLEITSWLGMGATSTYSFMLVWLEPVQSCACCPSVCEFICVSFLLCLEDTVSFESSIPHGAQNLCTSSSTQFPDLLRLDEDIPFSLSVQGPRCVSVSSHLTVGPSFSDDGWMRHWSMSSKMSFRDILLLYFFSRTAVLGWRWGSYFEWNIFPNFLRE